MFTVVLDSHKDVFSATCRLSDNMFDENATLAETIGLSPDSAICRLLEDHPEIEQYNVIGYLQWCELYDQHWQECSDNEKTDIEEISDIVATLQEDCKMLLDRIAKLSDLINALTQSEDD